MDLTNSRKKESLIANEIETICHIVREKIADKFGLISIIWHGGFSIGEGGLYRFKDRWLPYGDYDITIVSKTAIPRNIQDQIYRKILASLRYRSVIELDTDLSENAETFKIVDLKFVPYYSFIHKVADISSYDLKYCSRVLYGEDLRGRLKIDIRDISLASPLRIIFNRLFTSLDVFTVDFMKRKLNFMEIVALKLSITRIWLSLGMALSFSFGEYKVSYLERMKVLRKNESQIGTDIVDKIEEAVSFKLSPDFSNLDSKLLVKEWFLVMEKAGSILRLLLRKYIEIRPEENWINISPRLLKRFLPLYYGEYVKTQFPGSLWSNLDSYIIKALVSRMIGVWENIKLKGIRYRAKRLSSIFISPEGIFFAVIPLLAFSLKSNGEVEDLYLALARDILSPLYHHTVKEAGQSCWEREKKIFCSVIREYKHNKDSSRNIGNIIDKVRFWK